MFDHLWLKVDDFNRIVVKWQNEFPLITDKLGHSWQNKINYMRRNIRDWEKIF